MPRCRVQRQPAAATLHRRLRPVRALAASSDGAAAAAAVAQEGVEATAGTVHAPKLQALMLQRLRGGIPLGDPHTAAQRGGQKVAVLLLAAAARNGRQGGCIRPQLCWILSSICCAFCTRILAATGALGGHTDELQQTGPRAAAGRMQRAFRPQMLGMWGASESGHPKQVPKRPLCLA